MKEAFIERGGDWRKRLAAVAVALVVKKVC